MLTIAELLPYISILIVFIILIYYFYLKMRYGFWYYQPVFHIYDIGYYFFSPGIIKHDLPKENKYTNFKQIDTSQYNKTTNIQLQTFVNFIRTNFFNNGTNKYIPLRENIEPYFKGFNTPVFISFFNIKEPLLDNKSQQLVDNIRPIAVMTSRPLNVKINNGDPNSIFDVYYIDYLCVDMVYRKKGTAQQIIQTHEYNQRHSNNSIVVSLFKREGELTGIVPLCVYNMYCFDVTQWGAPRVSLHASYNITESNKQNLHYVNEFLETNCNLLFEIVIKPEISNILELIVTKNIFVYFILDGERQIQCIYFFRKSCTIVEREKEALTCFASIKGNVRDDVFINGFKLAAWKIMKQNPEFGFLVIENISHNNIIFNSLTIRNKPFIVSPAAYFFYNFAYKTFEPNKTFIIN
jgi:hypothetical protein